MTELKFLKELKAKRPSKKLENYDVIIHPLISEKCVGMIESQNKISFVVNNKATKSDVKKAVEEMYKIKVQEVKIVNDLKGRKKAIVRLDKKFKAEEVATKLGVI